MKFNSVPAWSFGGKYKGKIKNLDNPGPGSYNFKKASDFNKGKGYSLGKSKRDPDLGNYNSEIGPGQYNYNYSSIGKRGVSLKGNRRAL